MTTLKVVYDNRTLEPRFAPDWGFACLIETGDATMLFDTGADGAILLGNMKGLGISADRIDAVVLSHDHADHTGGLAALMWTNQTLRVHALPAMAYDVRASKPAGVAWNEATGQHEIAQGVWTMGSRGVSLPEQSIAIRGEAGQVVLTGCAHPGILEIVSRARDHGEVIEVIGGFHMKDMTAGECHSVIDGLLDLGVRRVAPCHCTGGNAMDMFRDAFGDRFTPVGVGSRFTV